MAATQRYMAFQERHTTSSQSIIRILLVRRKQATVASPISWSKVFFVGLTAWHVVLMFFVSLRMEVSTNSAQAKQPQAAYVSQADRLFGE